MTLSNDGLIRADYTIGADAGYAIADGTHFLFLDRPDRGRKRFVEEAVGFFA